MGNSVPSQKSRWDDVGVEPPAGEARYKAGEQPIAEYDNWFNKAVVDDIAALIAFLRNLGLTKIYQDVEKSKPASGAVTELFIATDTGKIYVGTGSGWRELTVDWNAILNKPSTFPPDSHTHSRNEITNLFASPFWSNIPDKPSKFPPSAHKHDASEIASGVLSVDRIPSLPRSKISDLFDSPFWAKIPDKPSTFPPSPHNHDSRYYTKSQLQTSGQASVHWDNISNKPSTFPPSKHKHEASDIASGILSLNTLPKIPYVKLDAVNNPSDGQVLSYDSKSNKFKWIDNDFEDIIAYLLSEVI